MSDDKQEPVTVIVEIHKQGGYEISLSNTSYPDEGEFTLLPATHTAVEKGELERMERMENIISFVTGYAKGMAMPLGNSKDIQERGCDLLASIEKMQAESGADA